MVSLLSTAGNSALPKRLCVTSVADKGISKQCVTVEKLSGLSSPPKMISLFGRSGGIETKPLDHHITSEWQTNDIQDRHRCYCQCNSSAGLQGHPFYNPATCQEDSQWSWPQNFASEGTVHCNSQLPEQRGFRGNLCRRTTATYPFRTSCNRVPWLSIQG